MTRDAMRVWIVAAVVVALAVVSTGVVVVVRRALADAAGSREVSCLFVRLIDQSVTSAKTRKEAGDEILKKLPKADKTRPARVKSRDEAAMQEAAGRVLARRARHFIECPQQ